MQNKICRDIIVALVIAFIAPVVIVAGVIYGLLLLPIVPVIFLAWLLFRKVKGNKQVVTQPVTRQTRIRKPITVKWGDKRIPLGVFIFSMILSILIFLVIIYLILFVIPIGYLVLCIILSIGICIGKHSKKK